MPANRSRTTGWRRCLQQVHERGGSLEIAVARSYDDTAADGRHLVWRVRLLALTPSEIVVEQPTTVGQAIHFEPGIELIAILAIGQNRWTFRTTNIGCVRHDLNGYRTVTAMRLEMPGRVERCQRRNHYRLQTNGITLPEIDVWPLLDPKSVVLAERANELQFERDARDPADSGSLDGFTDEEIMPELGPKFTATLLNIGGGGVGLRVKPEDAQVLARHKLFWIRCELEPELSTPICATGKLAHTSVDSTQHTYAGMAFDFSFNAGHQRFVAEQIRHYIERQQQGQRAQQGAAERRRRSA